MPIGLDKAPKTLPKAAQGLWVKTFNGVFDNCKGSEAACDESAAKLAWVQVKRQYRKVKEQWIARKSEAYHDVLLNITKASIQPDGSVRWQAVASDTGKDKAGEQTSLTLFQNWIDRITYKSDVAFLPEPRMPFLGVSHYSALDGYGEAGETRRMYIDGNSFKVDGVFTPSRPVGEKLLQAIKAELTLVKKGQTIEKPIRISAGWWDLAHYHEDSDFTFTRKSLSDKCPICLKGQTTDKIYMAGQLDHFAATRVPMNPRTSLEIEEKSMATKITRKQDAESIIGVDEAEELERLSRLVGKSDIDELPEGMVVRATSIGDFIKRKREAAEMTIVDLAAKTPVTDGTIGDIEAGVIETPSKPVIAAIAKALKISAKELNDLLPAGADPADTVAKAQASGKMKSGEFMRLLREKKKLKRAAVARQIGLEDEELEALEADEIAIEQMDGLAQVMKLSDKEKEDMLARFGKKRRKHPPTRKMDYDDDGHEMRKIRQPLGGATSMGEAEEFIETKEKMHTLRSHWDIFQTVVGNIMGASDEEVPDKVQAIGTAVADLGKQIDTLKAGLSDAFLIQESAAEPFEPADTINLQEEVTTMYEDYQDDEDHPADVLRSTVDDVLANSALSRPDQEKAVQEAFNAYAQEVQAEMDRANPLPPAEEIGQAIKGALADVLGPLTEQVGLLTAKMNQQAPQPANEPQQVFMPQQKSAVSGQIPQPVTGPEGQGNHVSPIIGKPSPLTDIIRKSVGIH